MFLWEKWLLSLPPLCIRVWFAPCPLGSYVYPLIWFCSSTERLFSSSVYNKRNGPKTIFVVGLSIDTDFIRRLNLKTMEIVARKMVNAISHATNANMTYIFPAYVYSMFELRLCPARSSDVNVTVTHNNFGKNDFPTGAPHRQGFPLIFAFILLFA